MSSIFFPDKTNICCKHELVNKQRERYK